MVKGLCLRSFERASSASVNNRCERTSAAKPSTMQHLKVQAVSGTSPGRGTTDKLSQWHRDATDAVWLEAANKMKKGEKKGHQTHNRNTMWTKHMVFKDWHTIYTWQARQQKAYIFHITVVVIGCRTKSLFIRRLSEKEPRVTFYILLFCFMN